VRLANSTRASILPERFDGHGSALLWRDWDVADLIARSGSIVPVEKKGQRFLVFPAALVLDLPGTSLLLDVDDPVLDHL